MKTNFKDPKLRYIFDFNKKETKTFLMCLGEKYQRYFIESLPNERGEVTVCGIGVVTSKGSKSEI